MRDDIAKVLLSEEEIRQRIAELGEQLSKDYENVEGDVVLLCILKGAVVFFADLARAMRIPMQMEFMGISSYGTEQKTSGIVRITKDLDTSISGKHVIIAEDIMDSGLTLLHLTKLLSSRSPASLRVCCLLDKPERRECDITPDYRGFLIPNEFVVGYGLDYEGFYRNLPFVGVLKSSVYTEQLYQSAAAAAGGEARKKKAPCRGSMRGARNNDRNPQMEDNCLNKKVMTAVIWVLLFAAIIYMVSGMNLTTKEPDELDYNTDFLQLVTNTETANAPSGKTIKAIQVNQREVYGLYGDSASTAKDLPKKTEFYVVIPSESTFRADMAAIVYAANPDKFTSVDEVSSADYSFAYESKIVEESIWSIILPYLLIFGAFGVFYFFMMRAQSGGKQMTNFGKSRARLQTGDKLHVTFADVAGADEEKEELREIVEFMRNPARFNAIGARIPKGVLLVGPPGTGKTLLAKAVAGEAKVPFFSISGSDFVEMFVGVGASRVRDLFQTAKRATPSVVFIDEIDAVGRHRGAGMGGGHDEREQTLNQLLVEMDGFAPNEGIIVIAATNRADILDPALLRPGRFDRQIMVGYPDVKGREEILKVHARNKPLAPEVELSVLAKRTPGFTGADLENVLNEAAILTARAGKKTIGMVELEEAITRVQMGPEKRSRVITESDKRITAYHEAGHAIIAIQLEGCDPVHEVSIIPRGMAAGYTMSLPKEDMMHITKNKLLDRIAMALGGRVAELLKFNDVSTGAYNDLQRSSEIAHKMVTEYGMSDSVGPIFLGGQEEVFIAKDWGHQRNYSESLAAKVDDEVRKILDEQYERAKAVISAEMDALDRVATVLIEYERISGEEFAAILRGEDPAAVMGKPKKKAPVKRTPKAPKTETEQGDMPNNAVPSGSEA